VLRGLDALFGLGLSVEEMRDVASGVGADVPFCVSGGTALGEGVGDVLSPLPAPPAHHLLLAKPDRSADTGGIYRAHDGRGACGVDSVEPVVAALRSGSLKAFAGAVGNDLEPVTAELVPEVASYKRALLQSGALAAAMTGTGTAVYGIFDAEDAAAGCPLRAPFLGTCQPVEAGVVMV
jgi:4-diphosphocytidyl-2-C-methyl-D-erythritol kinase